MTEEWNAFSHMGTGENKGWNVVEMMESNDVHVVPLNDTMQHELTGGCGCEPAETVKDGRLHLIHNGYDGRESYA